jgi:hypothetical protein
MCRAFDSRSGLFHSRDRSRTRTFKQFQLPKVPGNCLPVSFSISGNGIVWISLSIEHGDERKKSSHGFANSHWPYKCSQAMSEPIVDRAVRLMTDKELWP